MKQIIRDKLVPLFLLILISLIFIWPLFSDQFYLSHDGEAHVARFAAYYKAFQDGQFPLRWAGDLNYGYGSPVFIFYYPLPGLFSIALHILGSSFEGSFKLLIAFFFSLSFFTFFLWAKEFVKKEAAFVGALLYGLLPYHFLNLYVRGDIAELMALAIAPVGFLLVKKTIEVQSSKFIILAGVSYALLILSHNFVSLMFSPVLILYSLIRSKNKKDIILNLSSLILGLVLASFFWIPALLESKFLNARLFVGDMFKDHFPNFLRLIYSSWGFGPDVNKLGGLSPQIGIIPVALLVVGLFLIFKKNKNVMFLRFWILVFLISIFFVQPISIWFWKTLPLLRFSEFPWRIVGLSSFAAAVVGVLVVNKINNRKLLMLISLFIIISSIQFVRLGEIGARPDAFYLNYKGTTDYHGQASSRWTAGDFSSLPKNKYKVIEGSGIVIEQERKSNLHLLKVETQTIAKILDNTVYFPGWRVEVDGSRIPIEFQDQNHRGLITFNVSKGSHLVKVYFGESPVRLISDFVSLGGLLFIIAIFIWRSTIDKVISKL